MKLSKILFSSLLLTMLVNESFGMTPQRAMKILNPYKAGIKIPDCIIRCAVGAVAGVRDKDGRAVTTENLQAYLDLFDLGDTVEVVTKKFADKLRADLALLYADRQKLVEERKTREQVALKRRLGASTQQTGVVDQMLFALGDDGMYSTKADQSVVHPQVCSDYEYVSTLYDKFSELEEKVGAYMEYLSKKKDEFEEISETNHLVAKLLDDLADDGCYGASEISNLRNCAACDDCLNSLNSRYSGICSTSAYCDNKLDESKLEEANEKVELARKRIKKRSEDCMFADFEACISRCTAYAIGEADVINASLCGGLDRASKFLDNAVKSVNRSLQKIEDAFRYNEYKKDAVNNVRAKVGDFMKAADETRGLINKRMLTKPIWSLISNLGKGGAYSYSEENELFSIPGCEEKLMGIEKAFNAVKEVEKDLVDEEEFKTLTEMVERAQSVIRTRLEVLRFEDEVREMSNVFSNYTGRYTPLDMFLAQTEDDLDEMSEKVGEAFGTLKNKKEELMAKLEEVDLGSKGWPSIEQVWIRCQCGFDRINLSISVRKDQLKSYLNVDFVNDRLSYDECYSVASVHLLDTEEKCNELLGKIDKEIKFAEGGDLRDVVYKSRFEKLQERVANLKNEIEAQKTKVKEHGVDPDDVWLKELLSEDRSSRQTEANRALDVQLEQRLETEVKEAEDKVFRLERKSFLKEDTLRKLNVDDFYVKDSDYSEEKAVNAILAKTGNDVGFAEYSKLSAKNLESLSVALLEQYKQKKNELTLEQISNLFGAVEFVRLNGRYHGMCPNVYFLEIDAQDDFSYLMLSTLLNEINEVNLNDEEVVGNIVRRMESVASGIFRSVFAVHVHGVPNYRDANLMYYIKTFGLGYGVVDKQKLIEAELIRDLSADSNVGFRSRIVDACLSRMSLGMVKHPICFIKGCLKANAGSDSEIELGEKQKAFMLMLDNYEEIVSRVEQKLTETYFGKGDTRYVRISTLKDKAKGETDAEAKAKADAIVAFSERCLSNFLDQYCLLTALTWCHHFAASDGGAEPINLLKAACLDYLDMNSVHKAARKLTHSVHSDKVGIFDGKEILCDLSSCKDLESRFLSYVKTRLKDPGELMQRDLFSPYVRLKEVLYKLAVEAGETSMQTVIQNSDIFRQENCYYSFIEQYLRHTMRELIVK